jgi:hypothetical protein
MSTKDYKMIAAAMARSEAASEAVFGAQPAVTQTLRLLAEKLANGLEADNKNFNRELFIQACLPLSTAKADQVRENLWGDPLALVQKKAGA